MRERVSGVVAKVVVLRFIPKWIPINIHIGEGEQADAALSRCRKARLALVGEALSHQHPQKIGEGIDLLADTGPF